MLPIRNRSCGVIRVSPSRSAAAISASIAASGPRDGGPAQQPQQVAQPRQRSSPVSLLVLLRLSVAVGRLAVAHRRKAVRCLLVHMVSAYGVRHPQPREYLDLARFHDRGLGIALVIEAEQVQDAVHDEMARDGRPAACAAPPPRARRSRRRARHRRAGPARRPAAARPGRPVAKDSTLVGASLPRQSRFSSRCSASSVRTMPTRTGPSLAASVRRRAPRAPLSRPATRHRGRRPARRRTIRSR